MDNCRRIIEEEFFNYPDKFELRIYLEECNPENPDYIYIFPYNNNITRNYYVSYNNKEAFSTIKNNLQISIPNKIEYNVGSLLSRTKHLKWIFRKDLI